MLCCAGANLPERPLCWSNSGVGFPFLLNDIQQKKIKTPLLGCATCKVNNNLTQIRIISIFSVQVTNARNKMHIKLAISEDALMQKCQQTTIVSKSTSESLQIGTLLSRRNLYSLRTPRSNRSNMKYYPVPQFDFRSMLPAL